METNPVSRKYKTRSTTAESVAKSRVDWSRTKRYPFPKSQGDDEEIPSSSFSLSSSSSERDPKSRSKEDGEEEEEEEETSILSKSHGEAGSEADLQKGCSDVSSQDQEEGNISFVKRKRLRRAVMYDSDESSDSEVLSKGTATGRRVISEDDLSAGEESPTSPEEKAAKKKRERHLKLQELSCQQSRKSRRVNQWDEGGADHALMQRDGDSPLAEEEIDDLSSEDSMKNFIVDDEGEGEEEEKWVAQVDHYLHFQRVVKAFLINAIDDTFLRSLYEGERQKKYAQDMRTSLYYFDEGFIQPYLKRLVSRCRWNEQYKRRLDTYFDIYTINQCLEKRICDACDLNRDCGYIVVLSGEEYNPETMEVDHFMPLDTKPKKGMINETYLFRTPTVLFLIRFCTYVRLMIGRVCKRRTKVYHDLKHYKYKLYQKCSSAIEKHLRDEGGDENLQDEPVKDLVRRVFNLLEETGWIREQYSDLEHCQDEVAEFEQFLNKFKQDLLLYE